MSRKGPTGRMFGFGRRFWLRPQEYGPSGRKWAVLSVLTEYFCMLIPPFVMQVDVSTVLSLAQRISVCDYMANTRRNVRDGQEENVNATIVDNTGANIREDAGGVDGAARGARENEMPPPPPPLVVPPMDEAMANMMPMMQAFFTQMFQCLQLSVAAVAVGVVMTACGTCGKMHRGAKGSVTFAVILDIWLGTAEHLGMRKRLVRVVNVQKVISNNQLRGKTWHQGCICWALRMEQTR
ncbi:hypothetical protein F2Q69_00024036 [Brassica cretica]|uniref:Uncharacterized protein n=1 Tax=Brassica cretica TaxID=69181 RepID=A0A8S9PWP7_BRACR|nr:hypothetical protein F2Q69_00024036 [Brassica cretica]